MYGYIHVHSLGSGYIGLYTDCFCMYVTTAHAQALDWLPALAEPALTRAVFHQRQVCAMPTSPVTTTTVTLICVRGLSTEAVVATTTGLVLPGNVINDVTSQVSH